MRDHFMTAATFLAVVLCAAPLSVRAADKVDDAREKVEETTREVKGAVNDNWLTSKTKIALFANELIKSRQVSVETVNGDVYLRGQVDSEEAKTAAAEVAKGIDGVKSVKNELEIVPPTTRKVVTVDDKQITKAVESRFSSDPQLKKVDIRVNAGAVVLSGEVPTISAAAKASELAHGTNGVKSVKNVLRVAQAKAKTN